MVLFLVSSVSYSQPSIYIGAPLPLTGKLALEGEKQQRGYNLWANLVNKQGGINVNGIKHVVNIIYSDYQSDSTKVRKITEALVDTNNINFLFAPYGSMATRDASAVAQKKHIPMIAVTASSVQTYSRGHDYLFGIFTPNNTLIEPLISLVKENFPQIKKMALIIRDDLFPQSIAREIGIFSSKVGIDIIFYSKYNIGTTDYSLINQKLKTLRPDWIVALGYTTDLVLLRKQIAQYNITAPILTMIAAPAYQEFIDATGILAENVSSVSWWHPAIKYNGNDIFGTTENFVQLFKNRYSSLPDYVEASAALAGVLFQMSIERAGSIDGKKVRNELAKINETTFWGPIRFGKNGQNNASSPLIFQIQNGKPIIIYPTELAKGKMMLGIK
jgi:branched-chain amino acid transport system substrate-binding protein